MKSFRKAGSCLATAVALLVLTACNSQGAASSGVGDAEGGDADLEEANRIVGLHEDWYPSDLADLVPGPLSSPAPSGKHVAFIGCALPACTEIGDFVEEAVTELGWTVERYSVGATPDDIQSAFNSMIASRPDAAFGLGFAVEQIEEQLEQMEDLDIPYFVGGSTQEPGDRNDGAVYTISDQRTNAEIIAAWIVADSEGAADTAYFNITSVTSLQEKYEAFEEKYATLCPDCMLDPQNVIAADVGKDFPSQVVSYLQAHPNVTYIVFGNGALPTGVTQRLVEAGLDEQVTSIVSGGLRPAWDEIASGNGMTADVPVNTEYYAWAIVDRAARYFVGDPSTGPEFHETDGLGQPFKLITAGNIPDDLTLISGPDGFKESFLEYWGVN